MSLNLTKSNVQDLATFIIERENIRISKVLKSPKPWTLDPHLQKWRFCNVRRMDDRTSKWIHQRLVPEILDENDMFVYILAARMINWAPALSMVLELPWDMWHSRLCKYRDRGNKVFTSAYIVSTNGQKMDKLAYVNKVWEKAAAEYPVFEPIDCAEAYEMLMELHGIGSFMAGQIVADLKHIETSSIYQAHDKMSWCCPGPGSVRGLNRLLELDIKTKWANHKFQEVLLEISDLFIENHMVSNSLLRTMCMQDLQNCLCEYDKWKRCQNGGRPRAKYSSHENIYSVVDAL